MAARSLLSCLSYSLRRAQDRVPGLSNRSRFHLLSPEAGDCSGLSNLFDRVERVHRSATGIRTLGSLSSAISTSAANWEGGYGSPLSSNRRELESAVWASTHMVSYSSSAVTIEEDETVGLAAEIGYEVLGQYVAEGTRIEPQAAFAVVQVGSHQFKVTPGDMIYTEKLKYADINDKILLNKVLLLGSLKQTIIGRPIIPEAAVLAAVEEIALDAKVIVFKKKRRKNYRRTNGHRQELTRLRILQIEGIDARASASDHQAQLGENPV